MSIVQRPLLYKLRWADLVFVFCESAQRVSFVLLDLCMLNTKRRTCSQSWGSSSRSPAWILAASSSFDMFSFLQVERNPCSKEQGRSTPHSLRLITLYR